MSPFISIIVPVYNVEHFIARCARSLFGQSMKDIEYIFVDDCTPDRSVEVLRQVMDEYKSRQLNVKIISHNCNQGPGSARNTGLKIASGEYIYFCDSDDWLEPDAMERLHETAQRTGADLVWFDWYLSFSSKERWMHEEEEENPIACLKSILSGKLKFNLWNKIVRRALYIEHEVYFPEGHRMAEDMIMIKLYAYVNNICYIPLPLYHYTCNNYSSLTNSHSEESFIQIRHNSDAIIHFLQTIYGDMLDIELQYFKLNVKLPFLITNDKSSYKRWLEWYPEANSFIKRNTVISFKIRLLQRMAVYRQFWYIRLYYFLVYKVVATIIYK